MGYIKLLSSKLGISPSVRSSINMEKLTGTQKLMLTQARIFGNSIGGNMRNGSRVLRQNLQGERRLNQYELPVWNPTIIFPYLDEDEEIEDKDEMDDGRKMRIMMRGVKIGKSKGGAKISIMSIYEKKKEGNKQEDD